MEAVSYRGLSCRTESRQGRYWVVAKETGRLSADELSRLDIRMLERNVIPRLLQLDIESVNSEAVLRYRLPVGRTLKQIFQSGDGDLQLVLEVLHSLVIILEDSRLYMLDEGKYALHPSLIMAGEGAADLHVMYLPLLTMEEKPSVRQELYQLALQLLDWARVPPGTCPVLLDCLKSSLFELGEFKRLLVFLQTSPESQSAAVQPDNEAAAGLDTTNPDNERMNVMGEEVFRFPANHQPAAAGSVRPSPFTRPSGQDLEMPRPGGSAFSEMELEERILQEGDTMHFSAAGLNIAPATGLRVLLGVIVLAWGAAAWKQSEAFILLAAGITLIGVLLYLLWRKHGATAAAKEEEGEWDMPEADFPSLEPNPPVTQPPPVTPPRTFAWTKERQKLYAQHPAPTAILAEPSVKAAVQETELLLPQTELLVPRAVLEMKVDGVVVSTITISRSRFSFGRSPGETDCVISGRGISRIHGEIIREDGGWIIRDLGSRNGSWLNGVALKPRENYPLNDGDRITAAETELIFRLPGGS